MQKKHQLKTLYPYNVIVSVIGIDLESLIRGFSKFFQINELQYIMDEQERATLKIKILEEIEKTEKKILGLEEATKPISPENSIGRVSRMDAINNKSVAEASLRSSRQKLSKLKISLSKLDKPEFGNCVFCKNKIAPARLMYMPESTRCVRCADR